MMMRELFLTSLLSKEPQVSGKFLIKQTKVKSGIDRETAKKIFKAIQDATM